MIADAGALGTVDGSRDESYKMRAGADRPASRKGVSAPPCRVDHNAGAHAGGALIASAVPIKKPAI